MIDTEGGGAYADTLDSGMPGAGGADAGPDVSTDTWQDVGVDAVDAPFDANGEGCWPGTKPCSGLCVSLSDPAYGCDESSCAPCELPNAAAACANQECVVGSCDDGFDDCNGVQGDGCETQVSMTSSDCGECGRVCAVANGQAQCVAGSCEVLSCNAGFDDCNELASDGCEANLKTLEHCGSCGQTCEVVGDGTPSCASGTCQATGCAAGRGDCDGNAANGCETLLNTLENCGGCGTACSLSNATATCVTGECKVAQCLANYGNCDGNEGNGCETSIQTNDSHCGGCGFACEMTNAVSTACVAARCVPVCASDWRDCNGPQRGDADDGCEVNIKTDINHCGACSRTCSTTEVVTRTCTDGLCSSTCKVNRGNCTKPAAPAADDGCETHTDNNREHCGGCGAPCSMTNATANSCSSGVCSYTCSSGYANCNGLQPGATDDGCEVHLLTNTQHCGECAKPCVMTNAASASCAAGLCSYTCSAGWGDCNGPESGKDSDGCEVDVLTTVAHCGGCARACVNDGAIQTAQCELGLCTSTCKGSRSNCVYPAYPTADDGCETPSNSCPN